MVFPHLYSNIGNDNIGVKNEYTLPNTEDTDYNLMLNLLNIFNVFRYKVFII